MRSVTVRLDDLRTTVLNLGFVGENEHTQIRIDSKKMYDQYPTASPSLTVCPPAGESYPAVIERDGDFVIWTITDSNLIHYGEGEIQLSFTTGEVVAKTYIGRFKVSRSIIATGEIPEGIDDFLTRAGAALTAIPQTIDDALAEAKASGEFDGPQGPAGQDGTDGQDGQDGFSPTATVTKSGKVATITITDKNGTTTAQISDGEGGGTGDYTDLTNKPQIGGVTLTGNKSLHDLGIAAESDIPDPTSIIDDTAGDGDTNKVWSADKSSELLSEISQKQDAPSATGTAGQALVLDNNLHPVWGDVSINPEDIAEAVDDWLDEHPEATTTVEDGSITRAKLADTLKADTDAVGADFVDHGLAQYFYKADTYIKSGTETTLNGFDLYKIPVSLGDVVNVKQESGNENFWGTLNKAYAFMCVYNNAYATIGVDVGANYTFISADREMAGYTKTGYSAIMVCVKNGNEGTVSVYINSKDSMEIDGKLASKKDFPYSLTASNCIVSKRYVAAGGSIMTIVDPYKVYAHPVSENDRVVFGAAHGYGLNFYGTFVTKDDFTATQITERDFKVPEDGFICVFEDESAFIPVTIAKSGLKVDFSQIINSQDNSFSGMSGVAFGTSLTYRAQTTYGYLQYLPDLSGITFDNQGIGSATILGSGGGTDMLAAIKAYSSYSGKRVCTIEGFCNDWYQNKTLGTWKDTGETTVCGCVRSALNYVLSQNASLTVFLILDPYGRNYDNVDSSSQAVNASSLTQYEFYEEIAKVAESLGIPVIKEYAGSQISENTPQYIADNIHPNALGAKQSANFIWSKMRRYFANEIN